MTARERLLQLVKNAERRGEAEVDRQLGLVVETITRALKKPWDDFDKRSLTVPADAAGEAALWLDAAQCADRCLLADKRARFIELELSGDARVDRGHYLEACQGVISGQRGFVWMASRGSGSKTVCTYIDVGRGLGGVRFAGNAKASRALAASSHLTLFVPGKATLSSLRELQASVMILARAETGKEPEFQGPSDVELPESEVWHRIEALSDLLEQAGVHLFNRAKLHED
jgi:hypothetical protein